MYAVYSEIRDKKGLKDSDVAKGTGVSNQRLSHFLLEFQFCSKKVQRRVSTCDILSISVFTFLYARRQTQFGRQFLPTAGFSKKVKPIVTLFPSSDGIFLRIKKEDEFHPLGLP